MIKKYDDFLNEEYIHSEYLSWKRKNVTLRGIKEVGTTENGGSSMLGQGLYTAHLSNRALAKQYGKVLFVVGARPKNPIKFKTLNDWEIWEYNKLIANYCKENDIDTDRRSFDKHTSTRDEIMKLGYDGVEIRGREMVNYTPNEDDILYYHDEHQLQNYYEDYVSD